MTASDLARALGSLAFMAFVLFACLGMSIWMPWIVP